MTPWTTLASSLTPADQAWLLNEAGYRLRSLGRLTEAVEPAQAGPERRIGDRDWKNAARSGNNLSELKLILGEVFAAITVGEQSVSYADLDEDWSMQVIARSALADAMHQAGRRSDSGRLFENAESRQAANQPEYPRLYSLRGFSCCDLLLSDAEPAAWRRWLFGESAPSESFTNSVTACDAASERAREMLMGDMKYQGAPLLDIALDQLTLARATLSKADSSFPSSSSALEYVTAAVDGLRAAGTMDMLPLGLLTRAWLRYVSGDEAGCRADLDEAWEIAERGPMPLFQADILLYRARLFRDRDALVEARRLIEKHGYHRRDEELADAEEAAKGWPESPPSESPQPGVEPKASEEAVRDRVFISYSHEDEKLMKELLKHLNPYLRSGAVVKAWSDQQIAPGSQWFQQIQMELARTSVAVLLVSPDFLASDFIHEYELGPLLKEAEAGGVKILWVPIQASAYEETPLKHYQAVSSPDAPLGVLGKAERNGAWVQVCKEIKKAVNP